MHGAVFGLRQLGREKLFMFRGHYATGLDWLAALSHALSSTTAPRICTLIDRAWLDDDASVDIEWLLAELRAGAMGKSLHLQPMREVGAVSAVVVDVDGEVVDFYLPSKHPSPTPMRALRPSLPHVLRAPWCQLEPLRERSLAIVEQWRRVGRPVDDEREPSLRSFFVDL